MGRRGNRKKGSAHQLYRGNERTLRQANFTSMFAVFENHIPKRFRWKYPQEGESQLSSQDPLEQRMK